MNALTMWVIAGISTAATVGLIVVTIVVSRVLFFGKGTSRGKELLISLLAGASASSAFFTLAVLIGLVEDGYAWESMSLTAIGVVSLIPGIVVAIGSFWQFLVVGKSRTQLYRVLHKRERENKE